MLFSHDQSITIVYPNLNYPLVYVCHEKKIRFLLQMKFVLFIPNKLRVEMFFSRKQSINIMYPNGNYPLVYAHREKKLDSFP